FRTADGHLLLGSNSFTAGPRLYDTNLQPVATFGGDYRVFATQYLPQHVHPLAGDADGDGRVAFSDLLILAQHYGGPGDLTTGDFNNDHLVGFDDLLILAQNYGQSAPVTAAAAIAVPEPGAAVALVGGF